MYIQTKEDGSVNLTAAVMVPGVPDCDYKRGEPALSVEQIRNFAKSYEKYGYVDHEHELVRNGQRIGKPVKSEILDKDTELTLFDNSTITYPKGTWLLTTNLTEEKAVNSALKGEYTGYSPSVKTRRLADLYVNAINKLDQSPHVCLHALKSEIEGANKAFSQSGLIKNIVDPVVLSVSLVRKPCQTSSKFCKLKNNNTGESNMSDETINLKNRVLAAIGMSETAEVESLKSEISSVDKRVDGLESDFDTALKSMKADLEKTIVDTISEVLKEVVADKAQKKDEEQEEEEEEKPVQDKNKEKNQNDENSEEEDEEEEEEEEETKPPKRKRKGKSKSGKNHNSTTSADKSQMLDTYAFLGRNPDGTRK